jgi:hypothetical protein
MHKLVQTLILLIIIIIIIINSTTNLNMYRKEKKNSYQKYSYQRLLSTRFLTLRKILTVNQKIEHLIK